MPIKLHNTDQDIVIVGGGLAGLFCALKLAPRPDARAIAEAATPAERAVA